jgi:DNA mismatch repair protein MutS2
MRKKSDFESMIFGAELGEVTELDLHGMDRFLAERELDDFLHEQYMCGEEVVGIVHGRGTGILREAVHRVLDRHEMVEYFRDSQMPHSMMGVTYVVLVSRK